MSADNWQRALGIVLEKEGGKANLAHDPGGRTNQGITQDTYNYYRESIGAAPRTVFNMEDAERNAIYKKYWDAIGGDQLPAGVDLAAFDAAVNSGIFRAQGWLANAERQKNADAASEIASVSEQRSAAIRNTPAGRAYGPALQARIQDIRRKAETQAGVTVRMNHASAYDAINLAITHGINHRSTSSHRHKFS